MKDYFVWRLFSDDLYKSLMEIIKSGYIKPSYQTNNVSLFGHAKGSKYIYMTLNIVGDGTVKFYINPYYFTHIYLNFGWIGEPNYKSRMITKENIKIFKKEIKQYIDNLNKSNKVLYDLLQNFQLMTHEFLTSKKIKIKNAVYKIELNRGIDNIVDIENKIKVKYPHIIIKYS